MCVSVRVRKYGVTNRRQCTGHGGNASLLYRSSRARRRYRPARRAGECRRGNSSVLTVGSTARFHISSAASLFTDLPRLWRSALTAI